MSEKHERNSGSIRWTPGLLQVPEPVAHALTRFADASREAALRSAWGWIAALVVLLFTSLAAADALFRLETDTRRALALTAYLTLTVVGQWLLSRAILRRKPEDIATEMEARAPAGLLEERLLTTVELASRRSDSRLMEEDEGIAQPLAERVADETAERLQDIDTATWIDTRPARRAVILGGAAFAVALLLCVVPTLSMHIRYARALLPWIGLARPSQTQISLVPRNPRVVEGAEVVFEAELAGVPAEECFLETLEPRGNWRRTRMEKNNAGVFALRLGPVSTALRYRAAAGDGETQDYDLEVLPRPDIAALSFTVREPAYTQRPPQTFERAAGDIDALKGSTVELDVRSTIPLSAALLEFGDGRRVTLTVSGTQAKASFDVLRDLNYRVRLQSRDGVDNPDSPLFTVRAISDRAPQVSILQPIADGEADPAQVQPLEVRVEDDVGVRSLRLSVRSDRRSTAIETPLPAPENANRTWAITHGWDLAALFPEEGEVFYYRVEATDAAGIVGRSEERRLRVTTGLASGSGRALLEIERAQRNLQNATRLFQAALRDAGEILQVFRPRDLDTRNAERLLLDETLRRAVSETRAAAQSLERARPYADQPILASALAALRNGLQGLADGDLGSLQRAAARLHGSDPQRIQSGLDALLALAPPAQQRLEFLHSGTTAAHRFAGAVQLESRVKEIAEIQNRITPVLLGASGWSGDTGYWAGLQADYFRGTDLKQHVRQSTETRISILNNDLPELGKETFSIRYSGEIFAPSAGRYLFRTTSDDGVRLFIAGRKLIEEWRPQAPTEYEATIELTEGWHTFKLEFYQGGGTSALALQRSGPGIALSEVPPEQFRRPSAAVRMAPNPELNTAMSASASATAVQNALVRQNSAASMARSLPRNLIALSDLPPRVDSEGKAAGTAWMAEITAATLELTDTPRIHAGLAQPLVNWKNQIPAWLERFSATRARYEKELAEWEKKLATERFTFTARLRNLQRRSSAAARAFAQLVEAAKKPASPQRDADMHRADAAVRALSQDLQRQTQDLARELTSHAGDPRRPLAERQALKALESRVRELAQDPGAELERRLDEARDAEQLAESAARQPNFGHQVAELARKAGELSHHSERFEKIRAMADHANHTAKSTNDLREALAKSTTLESAGRQRRAAQSLRQAAQNMADAATESPDGATAQLSKELADAVLKLPLLAQVEERSAKIATGNYTPPPDATQDLANLEATAARITRSTQQALSQLASQLHGPLQPDLQAATAKAQEALALLNTTDRERIPESLTQAASLMETARRIAQSSAERLALEAEAAFDRTAKKTVQSPEDKLRLAALLNDVQQKQLAPLARDLASHLGTPDDNTLAQLRKQSEAAAKRLETVSKLAEGFAVPQKEAQQDASAKTKTELSNSEISALLEKAVARAKKLEEAAQKTSPEKALPEFEALTPGELGAQIASDLGQSAAPRRMAMAERAGTLADRLRSEAESIRTAAQRIQTTGVRAASTRESIGRELPQLVATIEKAASAAAPHTNLAGTLNSTARAMDSLRSKAPSLSPQEISTQLTQLVSQFEKPLAELTAQNGDPAKMTAIRAVGQNLRQAAGRMDDWSEELQRVDRAADHAEKDVVAMRGSRRGLEQQVKKALEALSNEAIATGETEAVRNTLQTKEAELSSERTAQRTDALAETLRSDADRLGTLAAGMTRLAALLESDAPARSNAIASQADSAIQAAQRELARAEAARVSGDATDATQRSENAADLLEYAAQSERDSAGGFNQLGPLNRNSPNFASRAPARPDRSAKSPAINAGGSLTEPPPGVPIDVATWNRLPENIRRDLLNAQAQRFPAEYEQSIRRYFKNLASAREDER